MGVLRIFKDGSVGDTVSIGVSDGVDEEGFSAEEVLFPVFNIAIPKYFLPHGAAECAFEQLPQYGEERIIQPYECVRLTPNDFPDR